jgi:hypothetical protein
MTSTRRRREREPRRNEAMRRLAAIAGLVCLAAGSAPAD